MASSGTVPVTFVTPLASEATWSPSILIIWGVELLVASTRSAEEVSKLSIPTLLLDGAKGSTVFGAVACRDNWKVAVGGSAPGLIISFSNTEVVAEG